MLIAFPLQQWLHERSTRLRFTSGLKEENASLTHLYFGFYVFIRLVLPFDDRKLIIAFYL